MEYNAPLEEHDESAASIDRSAIPTVDQWLSDVADRARSGAPSKALEPLVVETAVALERQNLEDAGVQVDRMIEMLRTKHARMRGD